MSAFDGVTLLDISAGQNTTFFIARPPPTPSELAAVSAPTPPTASATDSVPTPVAAAPAAGIDLSGFGFSFGAPPAALTAEQEKVASNKEKMSLGGENEISRTETEQWEEFLRYPTVLDATDACQVCGNEDKDEEQLECEMVSLPFDLLVKFSGRGIDVSFDAVRECLPWILFDSPHHRYSRR